MVYVLVPPLLPGACKSDYPPMKQRPWTRQRQTTAKGKAQAGDNLGSKELVYVLQVAFENWPGAGSTGHSRKKTKAAREMVVGGITRTTKRRERQGSSPRPPCPCIRRWPQHSHATQRVTASTGCDQWQYTQVDEGHALILQVTAECGGCHPVPDETRSPTRVRGLCRRVERGHAIHTLRPPRRKRRRMADDHEQDDSDDSGIEVIVDAPRELLYGACPRTGPNHSCLADRSIDTSPAAPPSRITPRHHPPSSPIMPPDFNLLAGLPLTILPAPART
ncbi:hypothetical protein EDB83DRAFT_119289 [Lactarius deliciosus]|nr:hypothetical protein EDB83DRAFT_119289 [Lactarius deliciosus]